MLGFFRRRKEKAERKEALRKFASLFADECKAEVEIFVELEVAPLRDAFLEVLKGQLESIDEKVEEFGGEGITREFAARNELEILADEWSKRMPRFIESSREFLASQYEEAEVIGTRNELEQYVLMALADQGLKLFGAGVDAVAATVGESAVADLRGE